jgi:hypothetical protein
VEGEEGSEEPSLNSSREEEDVTGDNERGEGDAVERGGGSGGWCQIEEMTETGCTTAVNESEGSLEQSEAREMEEVMAQVVIDEVPKEVEDKRAGEGRDNLTAIGERPLSEESKAAPKSSGQQQQKAKEGNTEDSGIVKG